MIATEEKSPGMDLSIPVTIAELIEIRAGIIASWHEVNRAIDQAEEAFARIHDNDFRFHYEKGSLATEKRQDKIDIPEMTAALDYSLFVFALGKLNITQAMTDKAKDGFLAKIKEKKTVFDEMQLTGLAQNAHKLFRDSSLNTVREVYRQLIGIGYRAPASARLEKKKDNLQKIEKVFRIGYSDLELGEYDGTIREYSRRYQGFSGFRFNDLLTACRLIEGEGFTDYSNNLYSLCQAVPKGQEWLDAGYFTAQAYKNGNVKVRWNEEKMDVLDRLNAIGSGRENAMPDTMRKRYKADHFHDGGMPKAETFFAPDPEKDPNGDKDFAFYPTPESAALRMVDLAEFPEGDSDLSVLEPSAGDGALLSVIPWDFGCQAVEFNVYRFESLKKHFPQWSMVHGDFLKLRFDAEFDRVLMNPPFNDRIEAVHLVKAFSHLKPGGILVGILPDGWFTRSDLKSQVLREFLERNQHREPEGLPAGTFGRTRIVTRIVTLKKPMAASAGKEG